MGRRDTLLQGLIGVSWGVQTGCAVATENALHAIDFRTTRTKTQTLALILEANAAHVTRHTFHCQALAQQFLITYQ